MSAQPRSHALFDPECVAVLGASNDETKYGNWLSVQAVRMTDHRAVHLVNRRGESILGRPALRSLAELDEPVDLVVVTVPAHGFEAAVDDALNAGARAIVGVTAGFAELGADGRALQDRIVERVRSAGAVLLGPNCLGVLDSSTSLTLASNPLPPDELRSCRKAGTWRWSSAASSRRVATGSPASSPSATRPTSMRPTSSTPARTTPTPISSPSIARTSATAAPSSPRRPQPPGPEAGAAAHRRRTARRRSAAPSRIPARSPPTPRSSTRPATPRASIASPAPASSPTPPQRF